MRYDTQIRRIALCVSRLVCVILTPLPSLLLHNLALYGQPPHKQRFEGGGSEFVGAGMVDGGHNFPHPSISQQHVSMKGDLQRVCKCGQTPLTPTW